MIAIFLLYCKFSCCVINIALFSCWFMCIWLCIDYFVSAKMVFCTLFWRQNVLKTADFCGF